MLSGTGTERGAEDFITLISPRKLHLSARSELTNYRHPPQVITRFVPTSVENYFCNFSLVCCNVQTSTGWLSTQCRLSLFLSQHPELGHAHRARISCQSAQRATASHAGNSPRKFFHSSECDQESCDVSGSRTTSSFLSTSHVFSCTTHRSCTQIFCCPAIFSVLL